MINALEVYRRLKGEYDKTDQPLRERSSILPFGQYEDGSVGLAWPEILAAPAEGIANFGSYGYGEDAVPYNSRMAFDAAGGAMTGGFGVGLAGGMVDDVAKASSQNWLDLYHGTASPQQFDKLSARHATNRSERAIFAADRPEFAGRYAEGENGRIFKLRVPSDQVMDFDATKSYTRDPFEVAMDHAYDAQKGVVRMKTGKNQAPTYIVRDSSVIRYLNDPLYSNAPTGAAIPASMEASDTDPALMEYLKLYGL